MTLLSIVLVLLGFQNEVSVELIKKDISRFYQQEVTIVRDELPSYAYYPARNRYRADSILLYLIKKYPGKRVIALTSVDISASINQRPDWGVFGLASYQHNVSVTSTYRLKDNNLYERTFKVIIHELGHTYDLRHCSSKDPCIMKAANHSIRNVDKEPKGFCPSCNRLLYLSLDH
jgi:archaemetzincin